jgi:tetratricopeptide (TPR) repeat protein
MILDHILIFQDIDNDENAEKYYFQLLNTLNDNDPHIQHCLHNFGILAYKRSDFSVALDYLQQALDLELVSNVCEQLFIRSIYTWIGNIYFTQKCF